MTTGWRLRMVRESIHVLPEWSRKILTFRQALKLTQGELGKRLKTSAMAVSRWERGDAEPPADAYIRLGNIADDPLCWFFWGRAGLSTANASIFRRPHFLFLQTAMEPFDVAVAFGVMIRRASMCDAQPVQGLDEPGRSE